MVYDDYHVLDLITLIHRNLPHILLQFQNNVLVVLNSKSLIHFNSKSLRTGSNKTLGITERVLLVSCPVTQQSAPPLSIANYLICG